MRKFITDYTLYKYRFIIGYSIIALIVAGLLIIAGLYVPGGLSDAEQQSAVTSGQLSLESFQPESIINLPFHLLQKLSLSVFGVSNISIKLPALLLGALSVVGILILLQLWFKRNVAIITTFLIITTGQFLYVAQSGTPSILYVFWSVWLLVAAMFVSRSATWGFVWKILLFTVAALSLYTPLSVYILLAIASAALLHPHLRYIVKRLSKKRLALGAFCALILLAPLIRSLILDPSIGLTLLGIPQEAPQIASNLLQSFSQYIDFMSETTGPLMTPIYGLGSLLLIILGFYRLFTTKYTARSYIITAWLILLLPILAINPKFVSVTFVPMILLMGMGITILLSHWYQLFPKNPYARVIGLVPLAVLIGGMVFTGLDRYVYGYHYNPPLVSHFSVDLSIINKQIEQEDAITVVVDAKDHNFYSLIAGAHPNKKIAVTHAIPKTIRETTLVAGGIHKANAKKPPYRIITNGRAQNADRFYVYKIDKK